MKAIFLLFLEIMILKDFIHKYSTGGSADPIYDAFVARMSRAESGGKHTNSKGELIQNPYGSAKGKYQIIDSTWRGIERQLGRKLNRYSLEDNETAMRNLYSNYVGALMSKGVPVNNTTLYALHFKGNAGWVREALANPNAPVSKYFTPKEIQDNKAYLNVGTLGEVMNKLDRALDKKGGGNYKSNDMGAGQFNYSGGSNLFANDGINSQLRNLNDQIAGINFNSLPKETQEQIMKVKEAEYQESLENQRLAEESKIQEARRKELEEENKRIEAQLLAKQEERQRVIDTLPVLEFAERKKDTSYNDLLSSSQFSINI